ncbi:hypothetical protein ACO22_01328 [Paracoccidioides brasiliensis]|uniref:DUF7357 domain-containing protein n=1 Tax=Paracoccidioides brasiliensis TaxID=121759 RepID=A0A1D2JLX1_PARBR|nr:hypothetical protein ACO22_01328 [Paracoccidioides brasiliensis]
MRLHLIIQRHCLPTTRVLWTTSSHFSPPSSSAVSSFATVSSSTITSTRAPNAGFGAGTAAAASGSGGLSISQLLEDVNEVIPLETQVEEEFGNGGGIGGGVGQWGLEDYVVEVAGFECLHFMEVDGLLRDGDEVVIRALQLNDLIARRLTGRHQISTDGRHLIDGVPFGKPYIQKAVPSRPPIIIPPRKKRRLNFGGWQVDNAVAEDIIDEDCDDKENDPDWKEDGDGIGKELVLADADEDEDDDDYEGESASEEYSPPSEEEIPIAPKERIKEQPVPKAGNMSPDTRAYKRQAAKKANQLKQMESPTTERKLQGILDRKQQSAPAASPKRKRSVSFQDRPSFHSNMSASSGGTSESDSASSSDTGESSDNDERSSVSSSDSGSSETSSESSSSSVGSSSSSGSETPSVLNAIKKRKVVGEQVVITPKTTTGPRPPVHPPGAGSRRTKNTNKRAKLRRKLQKLKELRILPKDAKFDDLRKWCEANPGPLPRGLDKESPNTQENFDDEQTEFERKRAELLRDIAFGGVDESPQLTKETIKLNPLEPVSKTPMVGGIGMSKPTESSKRQSKLDVKNSRQLLFGSLGVKSPKSKEDVKALREMLSKTPKPKSRSASASAEEVDKITKKEADSVENWKDRLILQATECIYDNVKLSTPPFPFVQRWDKDAQAAIRECKGNQQSNSKKRKRKTQNHQGDYYDQEWGNGEPSTSNEIELDYKTNGLDENHTSTKVMAAAVGDQLNYEMAGVETSSHDMGTDSDELPALPEDMSFLKDAGDTDMKPGAIIAFKQLDLSGATMWQPMVSQYRTAVIENVVGGTLTLRLAQRDREQPQEHYDDDDQATQYSKFEMPGFTEKKGKDNGFREMQFGEFIEPKLLSAARADSTVGVSEVTVAVERVEETQNPLPIELPPPVPEDITISSPTRRNISDMIREAGFRSGFDSDILLPEETFFTARGSTTHNDAANEDMEMNEFAGPNEDYEPLPPIPLGTSRSFPEEQIVTEVPSSLAWLEGHASDPSLLTLGLNSDHQKSSALSDGHLEYLDTDGIPTQDSLTAAPNPVATSQHRSQFEETHMDMGLDSEVKSSDDDLANSNNIQNLSQAFPVSAAAACNSTLQFFQVDQGELKPEKSSVLNARNCQESHTGRYRPGSGADSVITNPFHESDRGFGRMSPSVPRLISTAPPRTASAVQFPPASVTRRNERKALAPPRQRSSSPHVSQSIDDRTGVPAILEASKESMQHSEYEPQSQAAAVAAESSYNIVDLTISSDLDTSPNLDGDFAVSQGLPQGPGWVKKQGLRHGRGRGAGSNLEQARRRGLRRRGVI